MPGQRIGLCFSGAHSSASSRHIVARTLAGLLALIPLIVTVVIILVIIGRTDEAVQPFVEDGPLDFPGFGLLALIAVCYAIGVAVSTMPGRKLMEGASVILNHIPIVSTIYGLSEKAMRALTSQQHFSRVVFVEWPRVGSVAIGFVTGSLERSRSRGAHSHRIHPDGPQPDLRQHGLRTGGRDPGNRPYGRGRHEAGLLRRYSASQRDML